MKLIFKINLKVQPILVVLFFFGFNFGFSQTYFSKILPGWENSKFHETDSSFISFGMGTDWTNYPNFKNYIQLTEIDKVDLSILSNRLQIDTHN